MLGLDANGRHKGPVNALVSRIAGKGPQVAADRAHVPACQGAGQGGVGLFYGFQDLVHVVLLLTYQVEQVVDHLLPYD